VVHAAALIPLAGSALVASLLGSPHCFAMCGGFVCFYSGQGAEHRLRPQLAYHGGRLISYATLGALAGALGVGIDHLGVAAGLQRTAAVIAGFGILVWGGLAIVAARGIQLGPWAAHRAGRSPIAAMLRRIHAWSPAARALALGLVTTLLPCGWLYLFVATAAGTGSVAAGVVVMTAFWLGTVPILAGLGLAAQRAITPLRARMPALSAAVLIVAGLLTITGKFHVASGAAWCHTTAGHAIHGRR